eukprot:gene2658-5214_t
MLGSGVRESLISKNTFSYDTITDHNATNYLLQRLAEKQKVVRVKEILSTGDSTYKTITPWEIFSHVRVNAAQIDSKVDCIHLSSAASMFSRRDLRRLKHKFSPQEEPVILIRRHAVMISIDPIHAIIMQHKIMVVISEEANYSISELERQLQREISSPYEDTQASFEVKAYDAVLSSVIANENNNYADMMKEADELLRAFNSGTIISIRLQERMRQLKNRLSRMLAHMKGRRRLFVELLDNEEDMALMNLSILYKKPTLYDLPLRPEILGTHEEIETLVESYLLDYTSLEKKLEVLQSRIQNAEELVILRLDTTRNRLLTVDVSIAVITTVLAFGSYIGSMWGMNLKTNLEYKAGVFWWINGCNFIAMLAAMVLSIWYFKCIGVLPMSAVNQRL